MTGFDQATAVVPLGDGSYHVRLDDNWQIAGKLNGGYILALLGRAVVESAGNDFEHPLAASCHYLRPPEFGAAVIKIEILRVGRSTHQARASLYQHEKLCVEALITTGTLSGEVFWDSVTAPQIPAITDCVLLTTEGPGFTVPLMAVVSERLDPNCLGWAAGKPSGRGLLQGWIEFADGRLVDPLGLLVLVDALPPASFDLGIGGWTPTLELTCHIRAVPAPGPLMVRQQARHVAGGWMDEVCDIWDSTGRLVATGHQLAGIRLPR